MVNLKSQSSDKERSKKWPKESKNVLTPPLFFHKDLSPGILGSAVGRGSVVGRSAARSSRNFRNFIRNEVRGENTLSAQTTEEGKLVTKENLDFFSSWEAHILL